MARSITSQLAPARLAAALPACMLALVVSACTALPGLAAPTSTPTATPTSTPTPKPTATPAPTATATPTLAPLSITVRLEPEAVPQGQMATLVVELNRQATLSATLRGQPLPLFQEGNRWYALLPVWAGTPAGSWPLVVSAKDTTASQPVTVQRSLRITERQFELDEVTLTAETLSLLAPETVEQENQFLSGLLAPCSPNRLWQGSFLRPVAGEVTTDYGQRRSYNGGPASEYHGGLDLGIDEGTPVAATNAGRVVFAGPLKVRGNVVIIDHGWGLYSGYFHMSAIEVATGQQIQRGQVVGIIGSTGLSTGPHLHWQFWLAGDPIDPTYLETWQLP